MNLRPVIEREMLVEARHPGTVWVRLIIAGLGLVAFLLIVAFARFDPTTGSRLFLHLTSIYFVVIWCLAPLLTADTLSQERRENTLGLLFLTGLTGQEIVLGKSCAHSLRALNLLLTMIPFQILPVVLGGVTWAEIVFANTVNLASILLALAAGMLASALSRSWWRALPLALLLAALYLVLFTATLLLVNPAAHRTPVVPVAAAITPFPFPVDSAVAGWLAAPWGERLRLQFLNLHELQIQLSGATGGAGLFASRPGELASTVAASLVVVAGVAWWSHLAAAWTIGANWSRRPPSGRIQRWHHFWATPRFLRSLLQQRLAAAMDRNPVGWFHQRSWRARCLKWGWFLAVAIASALVLRETLVNYWSVPGTLRFVAGVLLVGVAFTAASSFRQEVESGSFELLLVSPLPAPLILGGRTRGVMSQYLPACGLLVIVWGAVYLDLPDIYFRLRHALHWGEPVVFASSVATLVFIGVSQSLHRRTVLRSWLVTLTLGLIIPFLLAFFFNLLAAALLMAGRPSFFSGSFVWLATFIGTQLALARLTWVVGCSALAARDSLLRPA